MEAMDPRSIMYRAHYLLDKMSHNLGLSEGETEEIKKIYKEAVFANIKRLNERDNNSFVPSISESRALRDYLLAILVQQYEVEGMDFISSAISFMQAGGNVLIISNHGSIADTGILCHVANRHFENVAENWIFVSGHVNNNNPLFLAISAGFNRLQVYAPKYLRVAKEEEKACMRETNKQAMRELANICSRGGQCIVMYPEGGRSSGGLTEGEPKTMKIPQIIHSVSPKDFIVLPSFVQSAGIVPIDRSKNEFENFLSNLRRGSAELRFGQGVMWQDLQPDTVELDEYRVKKNLVAYNHALKYALLSKCMRMIAAIAPEDCRGFYRL